MPVRQALDGTLDVKNIREIPRSLVLLFTAEYIRRKARQISFCKPHSLAKTFFRNIVQILYYML